MHFHSWLLCLVAHNTLHSWESRLRNCIAIGTKMSMVPFVDSPLTLVKIFQPPLEGNTYFNWVDTLNSKCYIVTVWSEAFLSIGPVASQCHVKIREKLCRRREEGKCWEGLYSRDSDWHHTHQQLLRPILSHCSNFLHDIILISHVDMWSGQRFHQPSRWALYRDSVSYTVGCTAELCLQ